MIKKVATSHSLSLAFALSVTSAVYCGEYPSQKLVPYYDIYVKYEEANQSKNFFRDFTELETNNLILRKLKLDDLDAIYELTKDSEVVKYTASLKLSAKREDALLIVNGILDRYKDDLPARWAVFHKAEKKVIGLCGFVDYAPLCYRAELAFAFIRSYWGQGLCTEASEAVLKFGFEHMKLNRVEGTCEVENYGSARVMEKLGMKCEGVMREQTWMRGKFCDRKLYSILKSEWELGKNQKAG